MQRTILSIVAAVVFAGGFAVAAAEAQPQARPAESSQPITLIGCITPAADGALRLTHVRSMSVDRGTTGATSAKASAPIGGLPADRPRTSGMVTPKGSTPIAVAPVSFTSSTRGTNSPKASTPVGGAASMYSLDAGDAEIASHAGHTVEITGSLDRQHVLKPVTVRRVAANCVS